MAFISNKYRMENKPVGRPGDGADETCAPTKLWPARCTRAASSHEHSAPPAQEYQQTCTQNGGKYR